MLQGKEFSSCPFIVTLSAAFLSFLCSELILLIFLSDLYADNQNFDWKLDTEAFSHLV